MASYHFDVLIVGRSDGRSAIAAAAYRSGAVIEDPATGRTHDYRRKRGIVSATILAPPDAPAWASDRSALWQAVEARETRKNSQLAREIRVALPHELDAEQQAALIHDWVQRECVSRGMIADIAIHDPSPSPVQHIVLSTRNTHAHVLLTMRPCDTSQPDGWAKNKARDWNETELLEHWRASWAESQNAALANVGSTARVDHRTLEAQRADALAAGDAALALALDRPPEPRMGIAAAAMERRAAHRAPARPPVTERGRAVADSRRLRARLYSALHAVRDAARAIAEAAGIKPRQPSSRFNAIAARVEQNWNAGVYDEPRRNEPDDSSCDWSQP